MFKKEPGIKPVSILKELYIKQHEILKLNRQSDLTFNAFLFTEKELERILVEALEQQERGMDTQRSPAAGGGRHSPTQALSSVSGAGGEVTDANII